MHDAMLFARSEHLKLRCGDAILAPFVSCDVDDSFGVWDVWRLELL